MENWQPGLLANVSRSRSQAEQTFFFWCVFYSQRSNNKIMGAGGWEKERRENKPAVPICLFPPHTSSIINSFDLSFAFAQLCLVRFVPQTRNTTTTTKTACRPHRPSQPSLFSPFFPSQHSVNSSFSQFEKLSFLNIQRTSLKISVRNTEFSLKYWCDI